MFCDPKLVGCWPTLVARLDAHAVVRRWSATEPELAGVDDVEALLAAWAEPGRTHRVGDALVRLAAVDGGYDDDALALLLHLVSGVVGRLVSQLGDLSADITGIVLSELTCQIRGYHWRTRRGGLLRNLELDTRRAVLADVWPNDRSRPEMVERLTFDGDLDREDPGNRETAGRDDEDDVDLIDLLVWAGACGVEADDLALLVDYECGLGRRGPAMYDVVARKYGISRRTLYRRRDRTLTALRGIAVDYLAAVA